MNDSRPCLGTVNFPGDPGASSGGPLQAIVTDKPEPCADRADSGSRKEWSMQEIKGIARVKFLPGKLEEWKRLTETRRCAGT
jgi:hypothetical protein